MVQTSKDGKSCIIEYEKCGKLKKIPKNNTSITLGFVL